MSVQLVVYRQSHNGVADPFSSLPQTEMLTNHNNFLVFTAYNGYFSMSGSQLSPTAVNNVYSTMVPGGWYAAYSTNMGGGVTGSLSAVFFYNGINCLFQKISGMTAGALYDVKITWDTGSAAAQAVLIRIYDASASGSIPTQTQFVTAVPNASAEATVQITAPSANHTIFLVQYENNTLPTIITSFSVKAAEEQPPQPVQEVDNGSFICDLYEDENIPLTLSVDNFKNAAEKVQSYSKAFNLPASKRNNLIFDNVFEITRYVDGQSINFNPLIQTKAVLKQDGFVIFEGFLRLLDISEKNGELSYNVNLYAEVTALADTLKIRTFQDLGFLELEHDYNITQIQNSWDNTGTGISYTYPADSGFRDAYDTVKYPFVDWNHQMVVSDGYGGTAGNPKLSKLEDAFRPFIQLKYLIDRIFSDSPFTYTSTFFNTTTFKKLYMDFNWGANENGAAPSQTGLLYQKTDQTTDQFMTQSFQLINLQTQQTLVGDNLWNVNRFTSDVNNLQVTGQYRLTLFNTNTVISGITRKVELRLQKMKTGPSGVVVLETLATTSGTLNPQGTLNGILQGSFSTTLNSGEFIGFRARQHDDSSNQVKVYLGNASYLDVDWNNNAAQVYTLLDSARSDLNQWEFLKGIMTMFNMVTIPDPDDVNNIIIETYEHVFIKSSNNNSVSLADRGITHNWTDKVNYETMKIEPLSELNKKTTFKYVEDEDDYAFSVYKRDVGGFLYGSAVWDATDLTLLAGEEEVVAEPFAATVLKPLMSQYQQFVIPSLYSMSEDGETASFDNSPRIMYNAGLSTTGTIDYYVPAQNSVGAATLTLYLKAGHLSSMPSSVSSLDYNFGACQLIPAWTPSVNNLFNRFWLPYYDELYDPNTRVVTVKINLNAGDINTFKFNDQVMIKNRAYRVNKIDYKPNDFATVELILLNYV